MDDRNTRIAAALERLFRTYQQSDRGEAADVARERIERAKVYFEAVSPYELVDIEAAIQSFITGSAPGVNVAFVPPAPVVASETRRLMTSRLRSEALEKSLHPALPPPDIERTPESQARVRELMNRTVAKLSAKPPGEDPIERHRRLMTRMNERFDAERGFSVGDPEDHEAAA